ncbi:MAG: beta-N-acetylglucosaminidase domain-containing protein, partial [Bacteroidaceae bacterium]|nr:beta-N-acetylglucosaminidase domain-containing protein [Bacteroidaceae bacterium]
MKFKNQITCTLLFLMATLFSNNLSAQKVEISPKPQIISWGSNKAFNNNVSYKLVGAETADADAVNLFKKNFTIADNGVEVIIGEIDDPVIKAQNISEADITEIAEGYYLQIEKNKVTIAGNDDRGTFYGVQTFIQLASQPEVMEVTVTDYPSISERGLVEGFYGNPYSEADRYDLFEFFGRQKMNVYIYGPKDDIYHKDKWREPYPEEQGKKIADYVAAAKANKVDFIW